MSRNRVVLPLWFLTFMLGTLCALVAVGAGAWLAFHRTRAVTEPAEQTCASDLHRGPWGKLDVLKIPLASMEEIDLAVDGHMHEPRWFFEGCTQEQLIRYFLSANLRANERGILLDQRYWHTRSNGCEISPPESAVYALDPGSRARLYAILSKSELNSAQRSPFRFVAERFRQDLSAIGLDGYEITRLENLTYTNAATLCLADLGLAQKVLKKQSFEDLVELLYSTPAYRLRLHVDQRSDIEALTAYWGRGGREKQVKPLLSSLAHVPGGATISITSLLPEFARNRLYTFPDARTEPYAMRQDCAYSAMNFFNRTEDTNYLNPDYVQQTLLRDYVPADSEPSFGDLIQLADEKGMIFHMSVYLADDFVFTKNGVSRTEPWTIMKLREMMLLYYSDKSDGRVLVLRRKDFAAPKASCPHRKVHFLPGSFA